MKAGFSLPASPVKKQRETRIRLERVKGTEAFMKYGVFWVFLNAGVQVGVQKLFSAESLFRLPWVF